MACGVGVFLWLFCLISFMWFSNHKLVLSHWDQAAFQMPSCWTLEEHKLESHPTHRKQCVMLFLEFILQLCYGINGPRFSNVPLSSLWDTGWNSLARFHSGWSCHLPLGIETCLWHIYMAVRPEVWSKEIKFWVQLQCIQPYWHLVLWSACMNAYFY